jgi:hypothetical protein
VSAVKQTLEDGLLPSWSEDEEETQDRTETLLHRETVRQLVAIITNCMKQNQTFNL